MTSSNTVEQLGQREIAFHSASGPSSIICAAGLRPAVQPHQAQGAFAIFFASLRFLNGITRTYRAGSSPPLNVANQRLTVPTQNTLFEILRKSLYRRLNRPRSGVP